MPGFGKKMRRVTKDKNELLVRKKRLRATILEFDQRISQMHQNFVKYHQGDIYKMPDLQDLERDLIVFSRTKLIEQELSQLLDTVLYKFQNRKKIWLKWVEEVHGTI